MLVGGDHLCWSWPSSFNWVKWQCFRIWVENGWENLTSCFKRMRFGQQRCHSKDPSLLSSLFTNNWNFLCIEICPSNGHLHLVIQVIVLLASVQYKCICRCRMPILNYLQDIHMRRFKCVPLTIVLNMNVSKAPLCHPLPPNALPACTPCGNTPAPNLVNQEPGVLSCMWSTCGVATIIICWTILTSKCVLVCSDRSWALYIKCGPL